MKTKYFCFLVLIALAAMVFSGTATAATNVTIDFGYYDQNGNEISTAQVGDVVTSRYTVKNTGNETAQDVTATLTPDLPTVDYTVVNEVISKGSIQGDTWNVGSLTPNESAFFYITFIVNGAGTDVTSVNVYEEGTLRDTDTATLVVTEAAGGENSVNAATVPMQETGTPLITLAIAILSVVGGFAAAIREL